MSAAKTREGLVEQLYDAPGKAEIVHGRVVCDDAAGGRPGRAATIIAASLLAHERFHGGGHAFGDNVGFLVSIRNRRSFSPDAAWFIGDVDRMKFLEGAPAFAVEVRSERDYGAAAEQAMAAKRAEYFAAGTRVVWDVDPLGEEVIRAFRAADPGRPSIYSRGGLADAEPAVPGWRLPVDELFR